MAPGLQEAVSVVAPVAGETVTPAEEIIVQLAAREQLTMRFAALLGSILDVKAVQRILSDRPTITDYHSQNATIATMVANPARRELQVTRGGIPQGAPVSYRLPAR